MLYRRGYAEMPLTAKERHHLLQYHVDVIPRTVPTEVVVDASGKVSVSKMFSSGSRLIAGL